MARTSTRKRMCGFHQVEHALDGFYHYQRTETSPERWICKARESARQKAKNERKKAEAAAKRSASKRTTSKRSTSKRTTARKTTRVKISA